MVVLVQVMHRQRELENFLASFALSRMNFDRFAHNGTTIITTTNKTPTPTCQPCRCPVSPSTLSVLRHSYFLSLVGKEGG